MVLKTPVALIIFNRPDTTQQVFNAIRKIKPLQLYLIADGARLNHPKDQENCEKVREIVAKVDWNCEVFRNYAQTNLGCQARVESGLNWVFNLVEEAIILEDDCLPHPTFFTYCEDLLNYYRQDSRIMMISGNNFQFSLQRTPYSYYFSRYPHTWGWATWRRAWQYYDKEMKQWPMVRETQALKAILEDDKSLRYWHSLFQKTYEGDDTVWDYRWTFACWLQNGLTVLPRVNLVANIGFGENSTHTGDHTHPLANIPTGAMTFPLQHPPMFLRHFAADTFTQNLVFQPPLWRKMIHKLRRIFKHNHLWEIF